MVVEVDHPNGDTFTTTGIPVDHSKTPGRIDRSPLALGEHNEEVLAELGYDDGEIERLRETGVIDD